MRRRIKLTSFGCQLLALSATGRHAEPCLCLGKVVSDADETAPDDQPLQGQPRVLPATDISVKIRQVSFCQTARLLVPLTLLQNQPISEGIHHTPDRSCGA